MSVSELAEYAGTNPRPEDFDEYWERALDEQRATDPMPELLPARFSCSFAECFDLYFTGVRGACIHAKYIRPREAPLPGPAVFVFHGYAMDSGDWTPLLPYAAEGICVAAMDCRGQGGLSEDVGGQGGGTFYGHIVRGLDGHPDNLYYRQVFLDTAQLVRVVSDFPEVDPGRLGAFGGSQGGGLAMACAALTPSIRRLAPMHPFLCDYQRIWEMNLAQRSYTELKQFFRQFDPRHEREHEIFTKLGYIDVQFLAPRIRGELLMYTGLRDSTCLPSSQFAAYNKAVCKKRVVFYPDYEHEQMPGQPDMTFEFMSAL